MIYYVYRITNLVNGNDYIGCHRTTYLDDGYMGSGKLIKLAIQKHGRENFRKDILSFHDTEDDMLVEEARMIQEHEPIYNIAPGGRGCVDNLLLGNQAFLDRLYDDPVFRDEWKASISRSVKAYQDRYGNPFQGREHNEETKRAIGEANMIFQAGKRNSQYGTRWITDGLVETKIGADDDITDGWYAGRLTKNAPPVPQPGMTRDFKPIVARPRSGRIPMDLRSLRSPMVLCKRCTNREEMTNTARYWYDRLVQSNAMSIRDFVRNSAYDKSHVAFISMLKKYVPEFRPEQGKHYMPSKV